MRLLLLHIYICGGVKDVAFNRTTALMDGTCVLDFVIMYEYVWLLLITCQKKVGVSHYVRSTDLCFERSLLSFFIVSRSVCRVDLPLLSDTIIRLKHTPNGWLKITLAIRLNFINHIYTSATSNAILGVTDERCTTRNGVMLSIAVQCLIFLPMERIRILGNGNIVLDIAEYDENGMLTRCEHEWLDSLADVSAMEKEQNKKIEIWN